MVLLGFFFKKAPFSLKSNKYLYIFRKIKKTIIMNLKQIQELIKFVAKSGATEVDLEIGDVKICIKSPR